MDAIGVKIMKIIKINTTPSYNVYVQDGLLKKVGELVNSIKSYDKIAIITDDAVQKLYLKSVVESFKGFSSQIVTYAFPNGEGSKNLIELGKIYDFLAEKEITRTDLVIALGGGVCGDMVGYAASSYLRGVDFINIPTTLLSMVDSSVGGKTAVNISAGKNQVGSFYQPKMVICDTHTLKTLSDNLIADGIGEIAKYAVLEDKGLFDLLINKDFDNHLEQIIEICVKIKDEYVSGDVFDKGKRQLLNLGHTLGHSIEKDSKYTLAHGKAVLIGLYYIAQKFAGTESVTKILEKLEAVANKFGMPLSYPLNADELWEMAVNDKKRHGDYITIARPVAIGDCRLENVKIGTPINLTENVLQGKFDIEITPKKLSGEIIPPPSKSHMHRLLIMSAFCGGNAVVNNVTFSNDIIATLNALNSLGVNFEVNKNCVKFAGVNLKNNIKIDCCESGSTFRFFIPICAMLGINATFEGSSRLGERGYSDIITAMSDSISFDKNVGLPLSISGKFSRDKIVINGGMSSQFISGIMMGAFATKINICIQIDGNLVSSGYVDMTIQVIEQFGGKVTKIKNGFEVNCEDIKAKNYDLYPEIDYSNLAFWEVAGVHFPLPKDNSKQGDKIVLDIVKKASKGKAFDIDIDTIPDLAPIFGVLLANMQGVSTLKNCARLRVKECDRLNATAEVLNKFGIEANISGDDLVITGGKIKGGVKLNSYGDHRMAMMQAIMATFADSKVLIENAQVVSKSYPNFWEDYITLGGDINVINIR